MSKKPDECDLFARGIPKQLREALKDEAGREERSMAGQLIVILRQRYPGAEKARNGRKGAVR